MNDPVEDAKREREAQLTRAIEEVRERSGAEGLTALYKSVAPKYDLDWQVLKDAYRASERANKLAAEAKNKKAMSPRCEAVFAHLTAMFELAVEGTAGLQSAYLGSDAINDPSSAVEVPLEVWTELVAAMKGEGWTVEDSWTSGTALKPPGASRYRFKKGPPSDPTPNEKKKYGKK